MTSWIKKLENRWGVNTSRVFIILLVFALTGFTVMFLKRPILDWILDGKEQTWIFTALYYILILPVYNLILLVYGFLLGQFDFFWNFEKRFFRRIFGRSKQR